MVVEEGELEGVKEVSRRTQHLERGNKSDYPSSGAVVLEPCFHEYSS